MKVILFSARPHDQRYFDAINQNRHDIIYQEARLDDQTVDLATGFDVVCVFVNDQLTGTVIARLAALGVTTIALRCVGFNNVDLPAAHDHGIQVVRVPEYSPEAVAEHTIALMLTLSRHLHRAYSRVRDGNFTLRGLEGFTFHGKTAGIVGTGKIGLAVARILRGMGVKCLAYDPKQNPEAEALGCHYVGLEEILRESDIITLHCPLNQATHHLIGKKQIETMKSGVMLINTSRGAVLDTGALIVGLKSQKIGYLGLDVYEQEGDLFFRDLSDEIIQDDVFQRLLTFPNVIVTGHLGFFTAEALTTIATTTLENLDAVAGGNVCVNQVLAEKVLA